MKIQSLSVVVPNSSCINSCAFCVACMGHDERLYSNQMDGNLPFYDLYLKDYLKRLEFCRDNGVNTVMLTGNSEPQQNRRFLTDFGVFMMLLDRPFRCIEMQTTGVLLDSNYLRFLRNHVGVNTISLSISSFDDTENRAIIGVKPNLKLELEDLCAEIRKYDFNLRLSVNLTECFNSMSAADIFTAAADRFGAHQITFRVLYSSGGDTEQDRWIAAHAARSTLVSEIRDYITAAGRPIGKLEYGQTKYAVHGLTTVLDDDCMSQELKEEIKYLILRPDCKLYSRWEDKASLIF